MKTQLRDFYNNKIIGTTDTRAEHRVDWLREMIAEWTGCDPDNDRIHSLETDDCEIVCVNEKPVARVRYFAGWDALGVG